MPPSEWQVSYIMLRMGHQMLIKDGKADAKDGKADAKDA